jgi:TPR repeat protein
MSGSLETERMMHTKRVSLVLMLGLLLGGCVKPLHTQQTQIRENEFSKKVSTYYDACLKRFAGNPAKAAYDCSYFYGLAAFYRNDFATAYKTFAPLAKQAQPEAQHQLGLMYLNGYGVPKDEKRAAHLVMQAAKQGYVGAMNTLSHLYEEGEGVIKDYSEAMRWREEAARLGSTMEYWSLGRAYQSGKITQRNPILAYTWLTLAVGTSDSGLRSVLEISLDELRNEMSDFQLAKALQLARDWKPGNLITTSH